MGVFPTAGTHKEFPIIRVAKGVKTARTVLVKTSDRTNSKTITREDLKPIFASSVSHSFTELFSQNYLSQR